MLTTSLKMVPTHLSSRHSAAPYGCYKVPWQDGSDPVIANAQSAWSDLHLALRSVGDPFVATLLGLTGLRPTLQQP